MPSEHLEMAHQAAEAMGRGDVEALATMCTRDVLLLPARSALHGGYVGPAGLRKFFADNAETFEFFAATWDETYEAGERVVMIGQITARARGGAPQVTFPAAMVISFQDGKIARAEDLRHRAAALDSVGLAP